ncbi:hypothetical protein EV182_003018, partial [Spiromyces aspiralis]
MCLEEQGRRPTPPGGRGPKEPRSEQEEMLLAVLNEPSDYTDDPSTPSLTFRAVLIGIILTIGMAFCNQFYWFRTKPFRLSSLVAQIFAFPLGWLLSVTLPTRKFTSFGVTWSLNPGKFTIKEHVLAVIMATASSGVPLAIDIAVIRKMFYNADLGWGPTLLLTLSSQLIGYSFAGIAKRILVYPRGMVWPNLFSQLAVYKSFHDLTKSHIHDAGKFAASDPDAMHHGSPAHAPHSPLGACSRMLVNSWRHSPRFWFFFLTFWASFVWYFVPGYLFTLLSVFPLMCLIVSSQYGAAAQIVKQLGDGLKGLGLFSFTFDWNVISNAYLSSPIVTPFWVASNVFVGFVILMWIIVPATYYKDVWGTRSLPIYGYNLYRRDNPAEPYASSKVIDQATQKLDQAKYAEYGPPIMPFIYVIEFGVSFASISAILSHVGLYHGRGIWTEVRPLLRPIEKALGRFRSDGNGRSSPEVVDEDECDIYTQLMRSYKQVPHWWYCALFIVTLILGLVVGEVYSVIPWYALLLAIAISGVFVIPVGIITAMTSILPTLGVLAEFIAGYMLPGDPIGNVTFKTYGYITMFQAISLVSDLKLAHYMKIPPRHVFICQVVGTVIATVVQVAVSYWLMNTNADLCVQREGNPWMCPQAGSFYSGSVIWGLVGPARMFGNGSPYSAIYYFFIIGLVLPVPFWYLSKRVWPRSRLLANINFPVMLSGLTFMPAALPVNYTMWYFWCVVFNWVVRKYWNQWWRSKVFTLSAALDTGMAISGIVIYFALTANTSIGSLKWWGNRSDFCSL